MIPPAVALSVWMLACLYFFRRCSPPIAVLAALLGGWAVLPSAAFAASAAAFPYWILGTCLPSNHFLTKATATGIAALAGILLFDRRSLAKIAPSLWDVPMAVWCLVPALSAMANGKGAGAGLRGVLYLFLAWGVPYLCGRIYFSDGEALELAGKAFVVAGLAYVPICLLEFFTGPQLYALLYGFQPYRWVGAARYVGFRPVGMLEDGNQLGIWMATSSLLAVWFWRRGSVEKLLGIPMAWVACVLLAVTLLCQSVGSIVLLLVLLPFLLAGPRLVGRALTAVVLLGVLALMSLRLANAVSLRALIDHNAHASAAAGFFRRIGRSSFGWRLEQDERYAGTAVRKPILGSAEWNWWQAKQSRPWSLWLLAFGMYGMVGLLALEGLQLAPVAGVFWAPRARSELERPDILGAIALTILMSAIDNLLNGSMILPLLVPIGALSSRSLPAGERSPTRVRQSDPQPA